MKTCRHTQGLKAEDFEQRLRDLGLKVTRSRMQLIKHLIVAARPVTAEEIHQKMKCDLVTIYRSLETFTKGGLINRLDFADGRAHYEIADPTNAKHHHHHIICRKCGKVENVELCFVKEQQSMVEKMGYSDISHRLEFFGICRKCQTTS